MPKKGFKVEVLGANVDPDAGRWGAVVELNTGRLEIEARGVSPKGAEKLFLAMNKHGFGPLLRVRGPFIDWKLRSGRDEVWDELVGDGATLPDDPKVAYYFLAERPNACFRVRFFNRELGPFALVMVMRALSKCVRLPKEGERAGDLSEWRKREAEWRSTWPKRWEKMRRFKKPELLGYRVVLKNTATGEEYEGWADSLGEAEAIARRVGERAGYTPVYEFALFDTWRVGPFLVIAYPERALQ